MKVKVAISFHDADNFTLIHKVGDVLDVSEERAKKLIDLGLVKKVVVKERQETAPVEEPVKVEQEAEEPKEVEEPKKVEPKASSRRRRK